MKTLLFTIALLATELINASVAEVKYLTKDEYLALMSQNSVAYEKIIPGMTIEYSETMTVHTDGVLTDVCPVEGQDTIMALSTTHYLVYTKITLSEDCGYEDKGETREFLKWRKIRTVIDEEKLLTKDLTKYRITQVSFDHILVVGETIDPETSAPVTFKRIMRLNVSQFRATYYLTEGSYSYSLFHYSMQDTSKVDISKVLDPNLN